MPDITGRGARERRQLRAAPLGHRRAARVRVRWGSARVPDGDPGRAPPASLHGNGSPPGAAPAPRTKTRVTSPSSARPGRRRGRVARRRRDRGPPLLDENSAPGGQIHRHLPGKPAPEGARAWLERLASSGALVRTGVSVARRRRASGRLPALRRERRRRPHDRQGAARRSGDGGPGALPPFPG
jgi:hypothetical protein